MLHMLPTTLLLTLPFASVWAAPYCSLVPPKSAASSSTATPTGGTSTGSTPSIPNINEGDIVATTWYAGWHAADFPLSNVSWKKYTSVTYAFALTAPDNTITLQDSDAQLLPQFVQAAHQNNVKALLTIGGWTGSQYFSTAVGSAANRTAFVQAATDLVTKYDLDGLDFDWEYPGKQGMGCNLISDQDSANFLTFLQSLRSTQEASNLTISAAVSITPFAGPGGTPMSDVSAFAKVLDYVAIMDYDVFGSWSSAVGPNAPLNDTCAPSSEQQGSAVSAVQAWTSAGFPANQIVLGVASYGHSFLVSQQSAAATTTSSSSSSVKLPAGTTAIAAYPSFNAAQQPKGDSWDEDAPAGVDQCGTPTQGGFSGIFDFWGLIQEGLLNSNGTAQAGMGFRFDECSQTPYIYNPQTQVMVSYDDPQSFAAKGQFINEAGLRGFAMWEAAGDYNDILLDSISNAIGIEEVGC